MLAAWLLPKATVQAPDAAAPAPVSAASAPVGAASAPDGSITGQTKADGNEAPSQKHSVPTEEVQSLPWDAPSKTELVRLPGLNLAGQGAKDELSIVRYHWAGDNQASAIVLVVKLFDGTTAAHLIPMDGDVKVMTGPVLREDRDTIFLEVHIPRSNYGATRVFMFGVSAADEDFPSTSITEFLWPEHFYEENLSLALKDTMWGSELVPIAGEACMALRLRFIDPLDHWGYISRTVRWNSQNYRWEELT